jgi:hypothetical protein
MARRGEHPARHLAGYGGVLRADACAGHGELYAPARKPASITEAACWADGRRQLFVLADLSRARLAIEAVRQINAIFDVEREINGDTAEQRLATRKVRIAPLVASLEGWMRAARATPTSPRRWTTCSSAGSRSRGSSTTAGSVL